MDYLSVLAADENFLPVLAMGALPYLVFGEFKYAALWAVLLFAFWTRQDLIIPEGLAVLVVWLYSIAQFIGMLNIAAEDKEHGD